MSTFAYAQMTTAREAAPVPPPTPAIGSTTRNYVDTLAALVPSEVLTLHALILSVTTAVTGGTTTISDPVTLGWSFFGLAALAAGIFVVPRFVNGDWGRWDWLRALIPPLSFVGWTMLQRATAFDAVCPQLGAGARTVIGLFLGVVLGALANFLAHKADHKPPPA